MIDYTIDNSQNQPAEITKAPLFFWLN